LNTYIDKISRVVHFYVLK